MFRSQKRGVLFLETSTGFNRRPHFIIECIPVPIAVEADAPMYFKQVPGADSQQQGQRLILIVNIA